MKANYFLKNAFTFAFLSLSLLSFQAKAQTVVNGIAYNVVDGTAEIAALPGGTKYTGTLTIPANVTISGTSYAVKKIGKDALRDAPELKAVIIPEGLEVIGNSSFASCTGITEMVLPASVKSIEDWAFYECSGMAKINIPDGITAITEHTFQKAGLTSIQLPASVKALNVCAFQDAVKLASINLENVRDIKGFALHGTALTSLNVNNTAIGAYAFQKCSNLESVVVKNASNISTEAFIETPKLKTVVLENVMTVGDWAFKNNENISSVTLTNVESLNTGVFSNCKAIKSLVLPSNLAYIGAWALEKTAITEIFASWENPDDDLFIEENAFGVDEGKINFTWKVPADLADVYGNTFYGYPVEVGMPSAIENTQFGTIKAFYSDGKLNMIDLKGYNVSVISLDGRIVKTFYVNEVDAEVPVSLTSGIYLLNATNNNDKVSTKFIVK